MTERPQSFNDQEMTAVIYCRISSKKQEREGDGLASQETRLRDYCLRMGYAVETVFRDKVTGSESQRPGLRSMIAFYREEQRRALRVVFDHLDRFTRNFYDHADLRREIAKLGATLETPRVCSTSVRPPVSWKT